MSHRPRKKTRPVPASPSGTPRTEPLGWLAGGVVLGVLIGILGTVAVLRPESLGLEPHRAGPARAVAVSPAQATNARIATLRERLASDPGDTGALLELAEVFAQAGQVDQATAHLERALEVAPDDAEVHTRAARLYSNLHRPKEALAAARRAMELDREAPAPALAAFDVAIHGTGDLEAARQALAEARRRAPSNAAVARAAARLEQIESMFRTARENPGDYDAQVKLGNFLYDAHRWSEAAEAYARALAIRDGDPNVITDYGTALFNQGKVQEALGQFEHALFADPKHWQAAYNGVVVTMNAGDPTAARLWLDRLRQIRPDHPEIPQFERSLESAGG